MGTRGTFGVRFDQKDMLAYNHFDSYPDGLGDDVFNQVKTAIAAEGSEPWDNALTVMLSQWREQAVCARVVKEGQKPTPSDKLKCRALGFVNVGVGDQSEDDWYCLLREAQGELLKLLAAGIFLDGNSFILDSLFCEWGYILNLDTEELEVYQGSQREPHSEGRYAQIDTAIKKRIEDYKGYAKRDGSKYEAPELYYPCALIATLPLRDMPKYESLTAFLKETGALKDEEDEAA